MKALQDFKGLIHSAISEHQPMQTVYATVVSVDFDQKTMIAKGLLDDLEYYDVLLGLDSFYQKPKVGSLVLLGLIENKEAAAFLICAKELEASYFKVGNTLLNLQEKGFCLKAENQSLKQLLLDMQKQTTRLCDEVNQIVVGVGKGPNVARINQIRQKITGDLKKQTNTLFYK